MDSSHRAPKSSIDMADEDIGQSRSASGSRRTRSQAVPDWSAVDELILVNEIAAVEADCLKALSSYQKWKIIAENCAAQDVSRSLNQYRRKWDSLLQDYNSIKRWESKSRRDSYWAMKTDRREELGLPRCFDEELFAAIGNLVRARENHSDTEPESDGEAKEETIDVAKELGSKRKRQQSTSQEKRSWKNLAEEDLSESFANEKPSKSRTKGKPPRSQAEKNPTQRSLEEKPVRKPELNEETPQLRSARKMTRKGHVEEKETVSIEEKEQMIEEKPVRNPTLEEEKPQQRSSKKMPRKGHVEEKKAIGIEDKEQMIEENPVRNPILEEEKVQRRQIGDVDHVKEETISIDDKEKMFALILRENAKRISSIVAEDAGFEAENAASADHDLQTESAEFVRHQGDKLIACLGDIVKTLDQLCALCPRI